LVGDEIHLHEAIVNPGGILKITHGTSTFAAQPGKKKPAEAGLLKLAKKIRCRETA
jgi:hypothetical protein